MGNPKKIFFCHLSSLFLAEFKKEKQGCFNRPCRTGATSAGLSSKQKPELFPQKEQCSHFHSTMSANTGRASIDYPPPLTTISRYFLYTRAPRSIKKPLQPQPQSGPFEKIDINYLISKLQILK